MDDIRWRPAAAAGANKIHIARMIVLVCMVNTTQDGVEIARCCVRLYVVTRS